MRLKNLEDAVARMRANPLGQAFSTSQSDGSVGIQIGENGYGAGATALIAYQGPETPRDPNTDQHPMLLFLGQLSVNGTPSTNGAIFYRSTGTECLLIGDLGTQVLDTLGHTVISSDEASGEGMARPWIPLPTPASTSFVHWPKTSSSGAMAESFFNGQHPRVFWNASVDADGGVSGTVQATITNGNTGATVSSATYTYSGTQVNINEVMVLPRPFYGDTFTFAINGTVTGGTGNLYCQTWELYGIQS